MVLQKIDLKKSYIIMDWECTFPMHWKHILFASNAIIKNFSELEILAGNPGGVPQRINPANKPDECAILVMKGFSKNFNANVQLRFDTEMRNAKLTVPRSIGWPTDYESLAKAAGQFMNIIELYMYTAK